MGKVTYTPRCRSCDLPKKPVGRSVSPYAANGYCDYECPGYWEDPRPTPYWSEADEREMRAFFGEES